MMQPIQSSSGTETKFSRDFLFPGLFLALITLADNYLIPQTTVTPLGCTILLTILAMYMRPNLLAFWGVVCLIAVFYHLQFGSNMDLDRRGLPVSEWMVAVRTMGSMVMTSALITLSYHRQKLSHHNNETVAILTKLPMPVLLSDDEGTILFMNNRAAEMLDLTSEQGVGMNYFELLLYQSAKGEMIKKYVDLIDASDTDSIDINIRLRNRPTKLLKGMLVSLKTRSGPQIITLITENYATSAVLYAMAARLASKKTRPHGQS